MSTRYLWEKFKIKYYLDADPIDDDEQGELFTRIDNLPQTLSIYSSYSFDENTGKVTLSGKKRDVTLTTTNINSGVDIKSGELTTGYTYPNIGGISSRFYQGPFSLHTYQYDNEYVRIYGGTKQIIRGTKGSSSGYATANTDNKYPADGISGTSYYNYYGLDNPDAIKVTIPSNIYGVDGCEVSVTDSSDVLVTTGLKYVYYYSVNDGSTWTRYGEYGYTTTATIPIPAGATSFKVRVQAKDTLGFTSQTYTVSNSATIKWNSPPNTPGTITVPDSIRGGEDTSIIWSAAADPDGNLDGYIVERSYNGGSSWSQIYQGPETAMFRVCAYDTYGKKSGWRTSENRTVINNRAPTAPPSISVPLKPMGGEKLTVTWTASTDADGNLEGYELERQWDGAGAFTQIYKGAGLSYQDSIPKGTHSRVVYRVRAYDSFAAYSSYTTSPTRQIDNNTAPVISCDLSGDLGEKSEGFTIPYTVSDAEQQEVTVVEKVGDLVKRTYKATLDEQATFEVKSEYFQKILNGAQTVQIVATDSAGKSSTLSLTFTKAVHKTVIMLSEPLAVEEQITVAVLSITGKISADATQLIELTNNGNDPEPVWEDATADVKAGRNYVFKNKSQTAGWAFNFRVTVERGESGEDGNIVSIQGGFQ